MSNWMWDVSDSLMDNDLTYAGVLLVVLAVGGLIGSALAFSLVAVIT